MNKIEEIFYENRDIFINSNMSLFELAKNTMKEFGKLAFEAGRADEDNGTIEGLWKYIDYEDFLKEIKNE